MNVGGQQHGQRGGGYGGQGPRPGGGSGGSRQPAGGGGGHPASNASRREENVAERLAKRLRDQATARYFVDAPSSDSQAAAGGREERRPVPRKELFDQEAEELAKKLANIPASQLRRFYSVVQRIKRRLDLDRSLGGDFIQSELAILKARGAYALARLDYRPDPSKGYDPDELLTMLVRHGRSVTDRDSFLAFARHFEAVMAFHKVYEDKRAARRSD